VAELCLELQPADADLAILLVPAEKQGRKNLPTSCSRKRGRSWRSW
jgi:hypothetical protein